MYYVLDLFYYIAHSGLVIDFDLQVSVISKEYSDASELKLFKTEGGSLGEVRVALLLKYYFSSHNIMRLLMT